VLEFLVEEISSIVFRRVYGEDGGDAGWDYQGR
jgi:hypothetical protein